jgi:hypothetical protein
MRLVGIWNLKELRLALVAMLVMLLTAVLLIVPSILAAETTRQGTERITLSPVSKRYNLSVGQAVKDSMIIINDGDTSYDFVVYARPYSVVNEQYDPNFSDTKDNSDVYQWVQFDQTRYHLEPGDRVEVGFTLRVPQRAAPGGHYGALFAETQPKSGDNSSVARKKRVGSIVYATVKGPYLTEGKFEEFLAETWQKRPPLTASTRVTNTGNVDFQTKVSVQITDLFGRQKYGFEGDYVILPRTTRQISTNWSEAPGFGLFKVAQTAEFLNKKSESSKYVLMMPRWVPIMLGLFVIAGGLYAVISRRKKRQ